MHLLLAGPPQLQRPDGRLLALNPLDAALLAWLALEGPTPRARLAALLWPDSPPDAARNALRQRLFKLKQQLEGGLDTGRDVVALGAVATHDLADADGVLEGTPGLPTGDFDAWLGQQRERRRQRMRDSLAELADMAEAARDWGDALSHARELLALDTLSEDAHRRVIRLHYLAGDRAAALLAFDACERRLKDEVGVRPDAQTLSLLRLVEQTGPTSPPEMPEGATPAAALLRPPAVVGRERCLATLREGWQAGRPLLVLGEPGIGKTRLMEALVERWPGALLVRARPGDAGVPLALLGRLLDAMEQEMAAARHWPGASALRALLVASGPGPTPRPPAGPLDEWLAAAAALARPPALVFDDWQFADSASVELLAPRIAAPGGLRFAVASRSGAGAQADARIAALQQLGLGPPLALGPLPLADLQTLVGALLPQAARPAALAAALGQRIGGNPLYVLEVLRQITLAGLPPEPEHVAAPGHVKALVADRLAQLPGPARQLLQLAAVAGGDFCVELAEAVTGRGALELAETWALLERQGLLGSHGAAHDVHAEVATEQLPQPIARVLHARVAAWLEARSRPLAVSPARVAGHWQAAGEAERASPHWAVAARLAWHAARPQEALDFFARAAAWHHAQADADAAFELWFDAADAMLEIGTPAQGERCLAELQGLARNERQVLRLALQAALLCHARGDSGALDTQAPGLLERAQRLGDVRVQAECRFALARLATAESHFDEAQRLLAEGEAQLLEAGDTRRALSMAASASLLHGLRGQPAIAVPALERVLPRLAAQQDTATALVVRASLALQRLRLGDVPAALEEADRVRPALEAAALGTSDTLVALRYLLETLRWAGRLPDALALDAWAATRLAGQGRFAGAQRNTATLMLALGRPDLAQPLLRLQRDADVPQRRERLRQQLLRAQAALHAGRAAVWPDDALAQDDLPLAAEWALWSGLAATSPWPLAELSALLQQCQAGRLNLFVGPLAALLAWRQGTAPPALAPVGGALPWTAVFAARAWRQVGRPEAADELLQQACLWVRGIADDGLPAPFRDSLLQRHPLHRELFAASPRQA